MFFRVNAREGFKLNSILPPLARDPSAYLPGDVIAWRLPGGRLHIGIVSNIRTTDARRYLLVHNIGAGEKLEDILFAYEIIGHYRYF